MILAISATPHQDLVGGVEALAGAVPARRSLASLCSGGHLGGGLGRSVAVPDIGLGLAERGDRCPDLAVPPRFLAGMAAAMAGVMRSPFTSIVFALELTHDVNALLALLVACTIAHLVSVLTLKRSILTEKIARRGYHVTREYEIDPLHALLVRDVMATDVLTVQPQTFTAELYERLPEGSADRRQRLYPVLDSDENLVGVLAFSDLLAARQSSSPPLASELARQPMIAFADETLREVADKMLSSGHGVLPVTDRENPLRLAGLVSQFDLLKAHERVLIEERHRERPLGPRGRSRGPRSRSPPARAHHDPAQPAGPAARRGLPAPTGVPLRATRLPALERTDGPRRGPHARAAPTAVGDTRVSHRVRADDRRSRAGAAHTPPQRRRARTTRRGHRADPRARPA